MNNAIRLLVLVAAAISLQGCVVFTYGDQGFKRVPTREVPGHLASVLGADQPADESTRTARNGK